MARPIKRYSRSKTSNDQVSAAYLASPPLAHFPRRVVEELICGLLKRVRRLQGNEALRTSTLRRMMYVLDTYIRELKARPSNSTQQLASEIERVLTERPSAANHFGWVVEHQGRLLADLLEGFPFSSKEDHRVLWLREHLPAILITLKKTNNCKHCGKIISLPTDDDLIQMARCSSAGELRNELLAYHHSLAISTVERFVASQY